tara:strand:- start:527 stop:1435 length:909 start_codon:yes stop_codon:yes gene_type:complete
VKNFIDINEFSREEILECIDDAIETKKKNSHSSSIGSGKVLAMIFEKKSTRTRLSFDVAIRQLGGSSIILDIGDIHLGAGNENLSDTSKSIALYVDALVLRVKEHKNIVEMSKNSNIPIINGLSNISHPCQVMADLMTIVEEKGSLDNLNLVWMGPITNVAHSLVEAFNKKLGFSLTIFCPLSLQRKYEEKCKTHGISFNNEIFRSNISKDILSKTDVILTDTWESMGEQNTKKDLKELQNFRVSKSIMDMTPSECLFMHCLPANRNQEVEAKVIDGPSSRVWKEAENRLHIQKQILINCFS